MTVPTRPTTATQQTTTPMWWLGAASTAVSAGAAVQLLVLTTGTEDVFAWTISVPASAALFGMFYLAATVMGVLALRQPAWAPARTALLPIVGFVGLVLVVTLLHLPTFHLTASGFPARAAAWIWLGVYVLTPIAYAIMLRDQARAPGGDPPRSAGLPRGAWWALAVLAAVLAVAGLGLLLAPVALAPLWPWALTALTARMTGATLLGVALLAASVVRIDDRATGRIAATGLVVCAGAALAAALGYGIGAVQWSEPSAWIYLVVCLLLGAAALAARRR